MRDKLRSLAGPRNIRGKKDSKSVRRWIWYGSGIGLGGEGAISVVVWWDGVGVRGGESDECNVVS